MKTETLYARVCPCCGAPLGTADSDSCQYCGATFTAEQKNQSKWIRNAKNLALLSDKAFNAYSSDFFSRAELELSATDFAMQKKRVTAEANRRMDLRMRNRLPWIVSAIIAILFAGFFMYKLIIGIALLFGLAFFVCLVVSGLQTGKLDEDDAEEIGDFLPDQVEKASNKRFLMAGVWLSGSLVCGIFANYAINNDMRTMGIVGIIAAVVCIAIALIQLMRDRK